MTTISQPTLDLAFITLSSSLKDETINLLKSLLITATPTTYYHSAEGLAIDPILLLTYSFVEIASAMKDVLQAINKDIFRHQISQATSSSSSSSSSSMDLTEMAQEVAFQNRVRSAQMIGQSLSLDFASIIEKTLIGLVRCDEKHNQSDTKGSDLKKDDNHNNEDNNSQTQNTEWMSSLTEMEEEEIDAEMEKNKENIAVGVAEEELEELDEETKAAKLELATKEAVTKITIGKVMSCKSIFHRMGSAILTYFPHLATKEEEGSGKLLIHHVCEYANPLLQDEALQLCLRFAPKSAGIADKKLGALPLHYFAKGCGKALNRDALTKLIRAFPAASSAQDNKGLSPLSYACARVNADKFLIEQLVADYKTACVTADDVGLLPLHYAVDRGSGEEDDMIMPSVLSILVKAHPAAVAKGSRKGLFPIHLCANRSNPNTQTLNFLIEKCPKALTAQTTADGGSFHPLHMLLQHPLSDSAVAAVTMMLEADTNNILCKTATSKGFLPLHLVLANLYPNEFYGHTLYNYNTSTSSDIESDKEEAHNNLAIRQEFKGITDVELSNSMKIATLLIEKYPEAAKVLTTDDHLLPLHCFLLSLNRLSSNKSDVSNLLKHQTPTPLSPVSTVTTTAITSTKNEIDVLDTVIPFLTRLSESYPKAAQATAFFPVNKKSNENCSNNNDNNTDSNTDNNDDNNDNSNDDGDDEETENLLISPRNLKPMTIRKTFTPISLASENPNLSLVLKILKKTIVAKLGDLLKESLESRIARTNGSAGVLQTIPTLPDLKLFRKDKIAAARDDSYRNDNSQTGKTFGGDGVGGGGNGVGDYSDDVSMMSFPLPNTKLKIIRKMKVGAKKIWKKK